MAMIVWLLQDSMWFSLNRMSQSKDDEEILIKVVFGRLSLPHASSSGIVGQTWFI